MTDLDLAAIRQRVEKATEGPWNTGFDYEKNDPIVLAPGYIEHTIDYPLTEVGLEHGKADAEFIAHAREDIPALLDEIDRLNVTIQRVRELHEPFTSGLADFCTECSSHGYAYCDAPCPTIRALEGGEQDD